MSTTAGNNEQQERAADEGDGDEGVGRATATRMKKRVARVLATATKRVRPTRVSDSEEGEQRRRG